MDKTVLRLMTMMGCSVFSWGLALSMASEAMEQLHSTKSNAHSSTALTLVEKEAHIEAPIGASAIGDDRTVAKTIAGEAFIPERLLVHALPVVPAVTPEVTPPDSTPEVTPQNTTVQPSVTEESVTPAESAATDSQDENDEPSGANASDLESMPGGDSPADEGEAELDRDEVSGADEEIDHDGAADIEPDSESAGAQTLDAPTGLDNGEIQPESADADPIQEPEVESSEQAEVEDSRIDGDRNTEGDRDTDEQTATTAEESNEDSDQAAGDQAASDQVDGDQEDDELTAAELERQQLLIEGDRLFLEGKFEEAEALYRQAKDPFHEEGTVEQPEGFFDPELLSPAGAVYWREYQSGLETGLETRIRVPLELLREKQPDFIPGQMAYTQLLTEEGEVNEALQILEQLTALYPDNPDLAMTRVDALVADEQWLQAAIASRQFAIFDPDHPDVETFQGQADEYQDRFRRKMRRRLTRTAIGNAIAGAVGFAVTGSWFGPLSAIETSILMIQGESAVGARIANNARDELDMIEDEVVLEYVNDIGQDLAELGGRTEFEYEFYVVAEDELNAFALPGGKIFINAGAITRTETGAELAGLIAHELAHAILSHGFQQVTRGNLTANVLQVVPYGGLVTNLTVLRYSRDMERQADRLGTRLLASSPYAADGLHRLMQILQEESENRSRFDWLSTHPDTPERVRNMERLIEENGYNRYSFEDVERHLRIQERVEAILIEMEKIDLDLEEEEETTPENDSESIPADDETPEVSDDETPEIPIEDSAESSNS